MRKDVLHEPFELVLKEFLDVCPRGEHAHSFFELVNVVAGTGKQVINQHAIGYRAGDLFLLAPNDQHSFDIESPTQLFSGGLPAIYHALQIQADRRPAAAYPQADKRDRG